MTPTVGGTGAIAGCPLRAPELAVVGHNTPHLAWLATWLLAGSAARPILAGRESDDRPRAAAGRLLPDRQRSSDASLLRRVEVATQRIRELETDNTRLRGALAEALGERRTISAGEPRHDTPTTQISRATRPC